MSLALVSRRAALLAPWNRNELWRRARAVPSLDLRFAENKSLVDATTGANLVTFTRASSGTYVDSQGVIRTAVTNLLLNSGDVAAAFTEQNSTATANAAVSPDGTTTATLLTPNTTLASHASFLTGLTFAASTTYSYSIFVKPNGYNYLQLLFTSGFNNNTAWVNFNLTGAGSIGFTGGGELSKQIQAYPNGWYRCTLIATSGAAPFSGGPAYLVLDSDRNSRDANYAGDNASGAYLWGAQLEQSSTVGEYIPTTSVINSAPRFDHDPTTGESLGLLVEESRTNLLLRSEEFDATWTLNDLNAFGSGSVANATTAPNGTATADLITENTSNSAHLIAQSISSAAVSAFSVYVKPNGRTWIYLQASMTGGSIPAVADRRVWINLSAKTVGTTGSTWSNIAITDIDGGWLRVSGVSNPVASGSAINIINVGITTADNTVTYTGDGTSGIYLWGAQLEAGAFATSYIPTTTTTVTRAADVASISGSNFGVFRTNLLQYSEEFDQSAWSLNRLQDFRNGSVANAIASPAGTVTADRIEESTATGQHYVSQSFTAASGTTYTVSVYLKVDNTDFAYISIEGAAFTTRRTLFDLGTETASAFTGSGFSFSITSAGNGWFRCSMSNTATNSGAGGVLIGTAKDNSISYTGNAGTGIYIWGAQLEVGSAATPYVKSDVNWTSRSSNATYYDASGTLRKSSYNLLLRSEEFDNASWTATGGSVTADDSSAPNGATSADLLTATATGSYQSRLVQSMSPITTQSYTLSCYAKANNSHFLGLRFVDAGFGNCSGYFNLLTGQVSYTDTVWTTLSISATDVGDGWYRCVISFSASSTDGSAEAWVYPTNGLDDNSVTTGNSIYLWGAQLETGTYAGDYAKTTTVPASTPRTAAYLPDGNGNFVSAGPLLLEKEATNYIRNNTMVGAVAGTPGTVPTNWAVGGSGNGITREIVGTGIEDGINYIDIRASGTTTAAFFLPIRSEGSQAIAASSGQTWTTSSYLKVAGGSLSNVSILVGINGNSSAGAGIEFPGNITAVPTGASLISQRFTNTGTLTNANVVFVQQYVQIQAVSGVAIDITLRIGLPQLEQGTSATSVILTQNAQATRAADVSTSAATTVFESDWYRQDEGTVFIDYKEGDLDTQNVLPFSDGTGDNIILVRRINSNVLRTVVVDSTVVQADLDHSNSNVNGQSLARAIAYKLNNCASVVNGGSASTDSSASIPLGINQVNIGSSISATNQIGGTIRRLTYWPQRLPNTTLQTITQ